MKVEIKVNTKPKPYYTFVDESYANELIKKHPNAYELKKKDVSKEKVSKEEKAKSST